MGICMGVGSYGMVLRVILVKGVGFAVLEGGKGRDEKELDYIESD